MLTKGAFLGGELRLPKPADHGSLVWRNNLQLTEVIVLPSWIVGSSLPSLCATKWTRELMASLPYSCHRFRASIGARKS